MTYTEAFARAKRRTEEGVPSMVRSHATKPGGFEVKKVALSCSWPRVRAFASGDRWRGPRGDQHYARLEPERLARGERHGMTHLTERDILEIRQSYAHRYFTMQELGDIFDVTSGAIWRIVHRLVWAHVA
jgi:hypothetical protein